jgi:hypothetical protein
MLRYCRSNFHSQKQNHEYYLKDTIHVGHSTGGGEVIHYVNKRGKGRVAKAAKLLKNGKLITYPGFPHGMPTTEAETINKDILAFIQE